MSRFPHVSEPENRPAGKGRPTPKRSEAQRTRKTVTAAPTTRKEAAARQRALAKAERTKQRTALSTGRDSDLPAYFRGPEKAAVRDAVDARSSLGWLALPSIGVNALSLVFRGTDRTSVYLSAVLTFLSLLLMLIVVVDAIRAARAVGRTLDERFPNGTEEKRGSLVRYGISRNFQRRGRRKPPPRPTPS
jgi:hypothetical protein